MLSYLNLSRNLTSIIPNNRIMSVDIQNNSSERAGSPEDIEDIEEELQLLAESDLPCAWIAKRLLLSSRG